MTGAIPGTATPVSVVVPTFNGSRSIAATLQSIAAQSAGKPQIIVVDDGSTDNTVQVVRNCGVDVLLLEQANRGVCAARNRGADSATGELICFVDHDDLWHVDHLRVQIALLAAHPDAGVAVSPYRHWPFHAAVPADWLQSTPAVEFDPDFTGWVYHQFMLDCWALTSATTIRRHVFREAGRFDETRAYAEDWDLWLRLSRRTPFVTARAPAVLYRQHGGQGSRVVREVDHRTVLLSAARAEHGLASRDGRQVSPALFASTMARYRAEFGRLHVAYGDLALGRRSLWAAWRREPARVWYLAQALCASAFPAWFRARLRK